MTVRVVERPDADKWAIRIADDAGQTLYEADSHQEAMEYVMQVTDDLEGWRRRGADEFVCDGEPLQRTITLYAPIPLPEPVEHCLGNGQWLPVTFAVQERYIPGPLERQAVGDHMERLLEEEDELAVARLVRRTDQRRAAGNVDAA